MNRVHGRDHFESLYVEDRTEGWAAVDLFRIEGGKKLRVARVAFWDAAGEARSATQLHQPATDGVAVLSQAARA